MSIILYQVICRVQSICLSIRFGYFMKPYGFLMIAIILLFVNIDIKKLRNYWTDLDGTFPGQLNVLWSNLDYFFFVGTGQPER